MSRFTFWVEKYFWEEALILSWYECLSGSMIKRQNLTLEVRLSLLPKGSSFTENSGNKAVVLLKGRSSIANSGTKVAALLGMTWATRQVN